MTCRVLFTLFATLAVAAPSFGEPLTFSGNVSGVWTNPLGGASSGAGTDTLLLGNGGNASLRFDANPTFTTAENTPFRLGQVTLWNYKATNVPSQATLQVNVGFTTPIQGSFSYDFVTHLSTNSSGTLSASVDVGSTLPLTGRDNSQYQITLLGFSDSSTWNNNATATVNSSTCSQKSTYIWAEIDPSGTIGAQGIGGTQVPEPTSLALGAIGLGIMALRCRRRK